MNKKIIIYVDMDGVMCHFYRRHQQMLLAEPDIKYPQSQYGFFRGLDPIENSIAVYKWLSSQDEFEVHILTAPSVPNPLCYTEKRIWVEENLGMEAAEKMIINGNKNLCHGDYLIDDFASGKGQDKFVGKLILFHQETNNWLDIKKFFTKKYKLGKNKWSITKFLNRKLFSK